MAFTPLSGRGKFSLALRDANGLAGGLFEIGNQSVVKTAFSEEVYKRKDYTVIASADRFSRRTAVSGTLDVTFLEVNDANLELLLSGNKQTQTTSARAEEVFTPATIAVGDKFWLGAVDITTAVIKDSTGTPVTLVSDTHYTADLEGGFITLLSVSGITGPLKRTITPSASSYIKLLTAAEREYFGVFDGNNIFATGAPRILGGFYRLRPSPAQDFSLISDNDAEFPVKFDILLDTTKAEDSVWGQFGFYKAF